LTEECIESSAQYIWKDAENDPEIISVLSNKSVIELSPLDGIKNPDASSEKFEIYSAFEFWSKKSMRNVTDLANKKITNTNEFFELHAQMILNNVDITDWTKETLVQFRIGIHITRT
jgi:hypothetical protein